MGRIRVLRLPLALLLGAAAAPAVTLHSLPVGSALADGGAWLLRPARQGEAARPGARFFRPLRQIIESVDATLKGQLDLERYGGHSPTAVLTRVLQRILTLTAAIWHNDHTSQPVMRSLIAYDHG